MTQSRGQQPHVQTETTKESKALSNRTKGIITLAVIALYLVFPADVIPDVMVGLGQIDDIIVFAVGVATILMRLKATKA
ncbi:MAG: DUF1232 domain-containing protein [Atopobiaceae bacterium]|nr:DUF1232 domain-containing protein [Atopobiaceae bacterium]